jgi:hypothetical protein
MSYTDLAGYFADNVTCNVLGYLYYTETSDEGFVPYYSLLCREEYNPPLLAQYLDCPYELAKDEYGWLKYSLDVHRAAPVDRVVSARFSVCMLGAFLEGAGATAFDHEGVELLFKNQSGYWHHRFYRAGESRI